MTALKQSFLTQELMDGEAAGPLRATVQRAGVEVYDSWGKVAPPRLPDWLCTDDVEPGPPASRLTRPPPRDPPPTAQQLRQTGAGQLALRLHRHLERHTGTERYTGMLVVATLSSSSAAI